MPRIRTIKPEFATDERLGTVSRDARLLFLLLISHADDEGRLGGHPRVLAGTLFPFDDDARDRVVDWLGELSAIGVIVTYRVNGNCYLQIANWKKHQRIDRPTESKLPAPPVEMPAQASSHLSGSPFGYVRPVEPSVEIDANASSFLSGSTIDAQEPAVELNSVANSTLSGSTDFSAPEMPQPFETKQFDEPSTNARRMLDEPSMLDLGPRIMDMDLGPRKGRKKSVQTVEQGRPGPTAPPDVFLGFDDFWDAYPRKDHRKRAMQAWQSACNRASQGKIIASARDFADVCRHRNTDPKYIPMATNWLNDDRWDDQMERIHGRCDVVRSTASALSSRAAVAQQVSDRLSDVADARR